MPWATPAPRTNARRLPLTWFLPGSDHGDALPFARDIMTLRRMDNVGIVVEDIDAAIEFFADALSPLVAPKR